MGCLMDAKRTYQFPRVARKVIRSKRAFSLTDITPPYTGNQNHQYGLLLPRRPLRLRVHPFRWTGQTSKHKINLDQQKHNFFFCTYLIFNRIVFCRTWCDLKERGAPTAILNASAFSFS